VSGGGFSHFFLFSRRGSLVERVVLGLVFFLVPLRVRILLLLIPGSVLLGFVMD